MYDIPLVYSLIHLLLGIVAYKYTTIIYIFLFYQIFQFIINKRIFMFELKIKDGNSIHHTLYKIIQFFIGFFIHYFISNNKFI